MILTIAVIFSIVLVWLAAAFYLAATRDLSLHQAILYAPLKLAYRVDDSRLRVVRGTDAPVIYVVAHQSRLDPALMLSLLPADTLHILDQESAASMWLEPWRELARTIAFNAHHVFVSRRLVRLLRGGGRLAVYIPDAIEPDAKAFRLYRAVARIATKADARILPVFIGGARHSYLSFAGADMPRRLLPKLSVSVLEPATIAELQERHGRESTTASNALFDRVAGTRLAAEDPPRSLFLAVRRSADLFGRDRPAVEDATSGVLSYRELLTEARALGGRLAELTAPGETIGLLLPNSNALAVSLLAANAAGRPAALLDVAWDANGVTQAIRTAGVSVVLASRAVAGENEGDVLVQAIEGAEARVFHLEDLQAAQSAFRRLSASGAWRRPIANSAPNRPAVVLFTAGAEGSPDAVVLSDNNMIATAVQVAARIALSPTDRFLSLEPVARAFGLIGGIVLPLLAGARSFLQQSPAAAVDEGSIPALARPTVLFAGAGRLAGLARTADEESIAALRLIVCGLEALPSESRALWRERTAVDIVETYGATEASGVIALASRTHGREGAVGRLLPSIERRLEALGGTAEGERLWIRGPNVMLGRMSADMPGILQPPLDGWHDCGDIVSLDREGFVTIRGRAARFADTGGEAETPAVGRRRARAA